MTRDTSPSWGGIADAVGHCMLVFAFGPTLVVLPRWLVLEARNPLNVQEPLVLAFLPLRAGLLLVNAFFDGMTQGVFAGVLVGLLLAGWYVWRGAVATTSGRLLLGAACGALGAAVMVATMLLLQGALAGLPTLPVAAVAFEIASGTVCGVLAVPHAARLLAAVGRPGHRDGISASASQ